MQTYVLHAQLPQVLQFLYERQATAVAAEAKTSHGCAWVGIQIEVEEAHIGLVAAHLAPERHAA
ncbi:hypothetical protein D3C80_2145680 [compost metagenome]